MNNRILWGILLLVMTGVVLRSSIVRPSPLILPTLTQVPPFQLIDETGQPFQSAALKNHIWIADFIFTSCAGQCPQMTEKMLLLQRRLPAGIHLVSISVDPARDTPEVLEAYARHNRAEAGRWHFLTGSPEVIGPLVQQGFRLSYAEEGENLMEPVTHSTRFVLVDPEGWIRGYYDSTDPKALEQLIREAVQLVH
ncbi:MAG: SCO family protein [Candidatus Omnitrophica bacterium]|nr:SCO family protein [Candidatus Omnitrophota bacterium]